jgi:hypothetical protein
MSLDNKTMCRNAGIKPKTTPTKINEDITIRRMAGVIRTTQVFPVSNPFVQQLNSKEKLLAEYTKLQTLNIQGNLSPLQKTLMEHVLQKLQEIAKMEENLPPSFGRGDANWHITQRVKKEYGHDNPKTYAELWAIYNKHVKENMPMEEAARAYRTQLDNQGLYYGDVNVDIDTDGNDPELNENEEYPFHELPNAETKLKMAQPQVKKMVSQMTPEEREIERKRIKDKMSAEKNTNLNVGPSVPPSGLSMKINESDDDYYQRIMAKLTAVDGKEDSELTPEDIEFKKQYANILKAMEPKKDGVNENEEPSADEPEGFVHASTGTWNRAKRRALSNKLSNTPDPDLSAVKAAMEKELAEKDPMYALRRHVAQTKNASDKVRQDYLDNLKSQHGKDKPINENDRDTKSDFYKMFIDSLKGLPKEERERRMLAYMNSGKSMGATHADIIKKQKPPTGRPSTPSDWDKPSEPIDESDSKFENEPIKMSPEVERLKRIAAAKEYIASKLFNARLRQGDIDREKKKEFDAFDPIIEADMNLNLYHPNPKMKLTDPEPEIPKDQSKKQPEKLVPQRGERLSPKKGEKIEMPRPSLYLNTHTQSPFDIDKDKRIEDAPKSPKMAEPSTFDKHNVKPGEDPFRHSNGKIPVGDDAPKLSMKEMLKYMSKNDLMEVLLELKKKKQNEIKLYSSPTPAYPGSKWVNDERPKQNDKVSKSRNDGDEEVNLDSFLQNMKNDIFPTTNEIAFPDDKDKTKDVEIPNDKILEPGWDSETTGSVDEISTASSVAGYNSANAFAAPGQKKNRGTEQSEREGYTLVGMQDEVIISKPKKVKSGIVKESDKVPNDYGTNKGLKYKTHQRPSTETPDRLTTEQIKQAIQEMKANRK